MKVERRNEIKVGFFLAVALVLTLAAIWMVGSAQTLFARRVHYYIKVPNAAGVASGAKVMLSGVHAGQVESLSLNRQDQTVTINLSIFSHFMDSVRKDSIAEIVTEGVLGDKQIAIAAGSPSSPQLSPESEISTRRESSLQSLVGKSDQLISQLSLLVKNVDQFLLILNQQLGNRALAKPLEKLDKILGKIDQGNGTLGGLVNDPELYDDVKAMLGESNDNRIVRNVVRNAAKSPEEKK